MACYQQRSGTEAMFGESVRLAGANVRSFGRDIQNIPDPRYNARSQSIKGTTGTSGQGFKVSMDLDSNVNEQENGVRRSSPRKFSMHVKHTSEVPQNHLKRLSSQIEPTHAYNMDAQRIAPQLPKPDSKEIEQELAKISKEDSEKPTLVGQYSKQIFEYLRSREGAFKINNYMERQMHLSERMRCILIDWIVEAHKKFRLLPETLFMTVSIIDRYLDLATCTREKFQLVGITALFISAKYEEIYPPPLKDFSEMTQKTYSKAEILQMEGNIVCALKFNLTVPSAYRFLERYSRVEKLDKKACDMSQYLLELALVEYKFVKVPESLKACAAIYLTNKLFKKNICWSDVIAAHSQHSEHQIRATAFDLCLMLQNASQASTQGVRKKFLSPQFSEVATIQLEKNNNGNMMNNPNGCQPHPQSAAPSQQSYINNNTNNNNNINNYLPSNNQNIPPNLPKYNY